MNISQTIYSLPSALRQAGVETEHFSSETLTIKELPETSIVRLHKLPGSESPAGGHAVLPDVTGQCRRHEPSVLCLRPREWLFISSSAEPANLLLQAQSSSDSDIFAADDLSDGLAVFRLSGSGGPWLLNKLSCLDYQFGMAAGEHCARTRMGHIAVVVHFHQGDDGGFVFDLIFDRSMAKYFWDLLCASAAHADELVQTHGEAA